MKDPIERQEAIRLITSYDGVVDKSVAKRLLMQMKPAEPKRPKGEWLYAEHNIAMCDGYMCDQCGFFVPWDYKHKFIDFIKDYHWCPSCGADMRPTRGEQDETSNI